MRLGSRNKRQGDRRNRQIFLKQPGVEPVFLEKAAHLFWADKFPNVQAKFICVSFYPSTITIERSQ
jgi:hypothetical protein